MQDPVTKKFEQITDIKAYRNEKESSKISDRGRNLLIENGIINENEQLQGKTREYRYDDDFYLANINYYHNQEKCYISWIKIRKDFRNQGLGQKAIKQLLEDLSDKNIKKVYIDCKSEPMRKIVKNQGFKKIEGTWYYKKLS